MPKSRMASHCTRRAYNRLGRCSYGTWTDVDCSAGATAAAAAAASAEVPPKDEEQLEKEAAAAE